eukprot:gene33946-41869_t
MIGFASIVMAMQQGNLLVINSESRATSLSLPVNWAGYFSRKLGDFEVPETLLRMPPVMAMLTEGLSFAMTILHSLQQAYGSQTLSSMERVEVHVLGAEVAETTVGETKYEEILHWLPACRELVIVLVSTKFFTEMKDDKTYDISIEDEDKQLVLDPARVTLVLACHSEPRVNPFRGLRPFPEIGEDNKFYYTNHSYIITRGSAGVNIFSSSVVQNVNRLEEMNDQDERTMELL